jgi:phenylalanyl-tRNA synthetase beta chain
MRVPLSWLREYVHVDATAAEIAHRLSISTAEVNEVVDVGVSADGGNLDLFRVGLVLEAAKHPNADRLQLCRVDVGEAQPSQIVCGAWNFGAGAKVAVALPGATLPNGLTLERRELRGQMSEGMILAEDEVDLGTDHDGIMVLDDALAPGTPLADVLPLAEQVLDIEPTGNRPDLLSVYGIAREVAALFGGELLPPPGVDPARDGDEAVDIRIDDLEGCPRYVGRLFRDVHIEDSPVWMKTRLRAAGVRAISNIVDVTNYVMLALGNPLHAFDFDTLKGGIVVRRARPGEEMRTLDGTLRKLDASDLMIADGERAVALAGIMGGEETEVSERTTSVLLEAANFEPVGILRSSERLALRTEGSNRWEKGVDPHLAGQAASLATQLVVELSGARWTGHTDAQGTLPERQRIVLRPERTRGLIGLDVADERQREILESVGFDVAAGWEVTVPTWRARDVTREVDLVEEVARFVLEEVPFTLPRRDATFGRLTRWQQLRRRAEDVLVGCGFAEAYTPTFVPVADDPDALQLPEPLSAEAAALRTSLRPSLVAAAQANVAVDNTEIALFEIARVYEPGDGQLPVERWHVAGIVDGGLAEAKWAVEQLYASLKLEPAYERATEPFLHPGKAARTSEGWVGELHPGVLDGEWGAFELDLDALVAAAPEAVAYEEVSPFPEVRQDLAFVVAEDVPAASVAAAMREAAGPELRDVQVFDEYRGGQIGEGKRSLAFRVAFGSPERTLTDEDAAALRGRIVDALAKQFDAVLRA